MVRLGVLLAFGVLGGVVAFVVGSTPIWSGISASSGPPGERQDPSTIYWRLVSLPVDPGLVIVGVAVGVLVGAALIGLYTLVARSRHHPGKQT